MNNGKVRIYELSKELNLDNKELLAICDQLNIAVKSHSSTISETEATQIREVSQKLTAARMAQKKELGINNHKPNSQKPGFRNRSATPRQQQILEIRKPKILRNTTSNALEASVATNGQFASSDSVNMTDPSATLPSQPRTFATSASPMKPTAPTRPIPKNQSENPHKSVVDTDHKSHAPAPEKIKGEKPEKPPAPKPRTEKPQKPQLVIPPSRPAGEKTSDTEQPLSTAEKPILKRERQQRREEEHGKPRATRPPTDQAPPQKTGRPTPPPIRAEHRGAKSTPGDIQRPTRPTRPSETAGDTSLKPMVGGGKKDLLVEEVIAPPLLDLKRPTPPRSAKTGKKWQEEEIIDELKEKSKVGIKSKRVKPILEDDFEDDDLMNEQGLEIPASVQVSLSIARPPKPKAPKATQQPALAVAPPTGRHKKPGAQRDQNRRQQPTEVEAQERPNKLIVTGPMTVQELAEALLVADTEIVKILFMKAMAVSITQSLDIPTITLVAKELEVEVETVEPEAEARKVTEMIDIEDLDHLIRRPPVVTIMGHVDHGKTTLLDSIRKTKVAAGEAGGITQHIGAYHVDVEHEGKTQQIVFLDTPGHEAFTAMRARGARVTDIAILVVAADDGVRPQTIEAISHAQAAGVPIVVAINKIDKEGAQPERVKQELTNYGLTAEDWGGETIMVPVSAIKGENLDTLLEMVLLVAEVAELSANPNRAAKGTVIEAHLDKAKGAVATLLIQNGSLHVGDMLVAGSAFGKVRAMVDDRGRRVDAATPSSAVEVLGLSDVPAAGDEFEVFENEKEARAIAGERADKQRQSRLLQGRVTLTTLSAQAQEGELKELNLILKGDVQGSVEAIIGSLKQIPQNEVQIRLLLATAGEITETDIDLAAASNAVIIGFNTTYASGARQAADEAGVDVREYNIIYKLLEDIQGALEGLLEPELVEEPLGQTEVRAVFPVGRGAVAGCYVQSGKLLRNCKVRIRRHSKVIYEGVLDSLKRMKEDVREVNSGYECGIGIEKFHDWIEGDVIEAYQMVTKRRTLTLTK
ncbi:MAG: translation initiation factor IF-2 [Cylindrospermopsis raciborskii KL1]|jgi:translation initiation factor IF-2|uniref:translation initiation factor IF-2 n=1 Tax=Cylindrospermopsis raciborskii TaxID=77022 RepID=UPI001A2BF453|nr:translation initiation factor IF-2 [Cylindrospermopsis raciborskii]MBG0742931.1 translation initiation factor IF-2 [Cylindrospermopsis raciborskii KL1]